MVSSNVPSVSLRVTEETARRLREDCVTTYLEENPDAIGLHVTDGFMVERLIKAYLREI